MAKKNEFCVNDKKRGSCWGEVKTWEDIKKMTDNTNIQKIETKMMGVLDDWNGNTTYGSDGSTASAYGNTVYYSTPDDQDDDDPYNNIYGYGYNNY